MPLTIGAARAVDSISLLREEGIMKKLTLNPEVLEVQSFVTAEEAPGRGTVHAEQQCTCPTYCSCPGCPTCGATCPNTCWETCDDPSCQSCGSCWASCEMTCYTGMCACDREP